MARSALCCSWPAPRGPGLNSPLKAVRPFRMSRGASSLARIGPPPGHATCRHIPEIQRGAWQPLPASSSCSCQAASSASSGCSITGVAEACSTPTAPTASRFSAGLQHQLQLARLSRHSPPNVASCSHCMSTPGSQRPPLHRLSGCHGPLPDLATRINGHQGYAPRPARPMHSPSPKKRSCARLTPPSTIPVGAVTLPCPEPTNHHHLWPDGQAAPTSSAHRGGAMPTSATSPGHQAPVGTSAC